MKTRHCVAATLALLLVTMPLAADDLTGTDHLLCVAEEVTVCAMGGQCEIGPPSLFNIPDFIEVDLEAGLLKTTEASRENRQTPILHLTREDGLIVVQGLEMERAFSFNIDEASGVLTVAVARPGLFVGGFGACTPLPVNHD
jgi:hypothetical protein